MVMQKWEIRYPLFFLILVHTITTQFLDEEVNVRNCTDCRNRCADREVRLLDSTNTATCLRCGCINDTTQLLNFTKNHPINVPFLFATPPLPGIGKDSEYSCIRWCNSSACQRLGTNEVLRRSGKALPDVRQQRVYVVLTASFWLSILNLTITVDSDNTWDVLQCRQLGETGVANAANLSIVAFEMTIPVVSGPKSVKPGMEWRWVCEMDFVTIRRVDDVVNVLDFELEIVDAGYLHVTSEGPVFSPISQQFVDGFKVSQELLLTVPARLMDTAFDLQCIAIQREVGATRTSLPLWVAVPNTNVKEIGVNLTTAGAIMGSMAILIACAFCTLYLLKTRKKPQDSAPSSAPYSAHQPAKLPAGQPATSALKAPTGGILKGKKTDTPETVQTPEESVAGDEQSAAEPDTSSPTDIQHLKATATKPPAAPTTQTTTTPAAATPSPSPPATTTPLAAGKTSPPTTAATTAAAAAKI